MIDGEEKGGIRVRKRKKGEGRMEMREDGRNKTTPKK